MENLLGQVIGSMPVGAVILLFIYFMIHRLNEICRKIDRLDKILIDHITVHPHCDDNGDDDDDEEDDEDNSEARRLAERN